MRNNNFSVREEDEFISVRLMQGFPRWRSSTSLIDPSILLTDHHTNLLHLVLGIWCEINTFFFSLFVTTWECIDIEKGNSFWLPLGSERASSLIAFYCSVKQIFLTCSWSCATISWFFSSVSCVLHCQLGTRVVIHVWRHDIWARSNTIEF